jgi:hypothetical protein
MGTTQTQKPTIVAGFAIGSPQAVLFLDLATKSSLRINASTFRETWVACASIIH